MKKTGFGSFLENQAVCSGSLGKYHWKGWPFCERKPIPGIKNPILSSID
jgi:hypothetical protein